MCRFSDAELNCVSTKIRLSPACRQLLIGMSMRRYLAPIGTAGFERWWVSGNNRVPRPPPRINVSTSFMDPILVPPPRRCQRGAWGSSGINGGETAPSRDRDDPMRRGAYSVASNGHGLGDTRTNFRAFSDKQLTIDFDGIPFNDTN